MKAKTPAKKRPSRKSKKPEQPQIRIDMRVENVPLDELLMSAVNARTHSKEQVAQIVASMLEFGFTNPVLIDPNNEIIAGHGRVLGAGELKMPVVPCIRLGHLTPEQVRAYRLADNKIALNSGWDEAKLKAEIEALQKLDFDVQLTGFGQDEITKIIAGLNEKPPPNVNIKSTFEVIIECTDESAQKQAYDFVIEKGLKCRLSTF